MEKRPLADLLRPKNLEDLVENFKINILDDDVKSQIIWGPPGCGKTSYAKILADKSKLQSISLSAVTSSSQQFKDVFKLAQSVGKVILLVDEIHHLNKSQQDIFLPYLENGSVVLIGTTTENPSFELRPALLSRCKVVVFNRLSIESLQMLLERAEKFLGKNLSLTQDARLFLCEIADGDGRYLLNIVEEIASEKSGKNLDVNDVSKILGRRSSIYDKSAEGHYNLISAFHKSLRGSDVDAALYWMARMINGGENPFYILRRIIRFASEDIGMADPNAMNVAIAAQQAYMCLGSPEGDLSIAHAVVYMATAPKSNAVYKAFNSVVDFSKKGSFPPPKHILNAPTKMMKDQGYGQGYIYDHDQPNAFSGQNYFPDGVKRQKFYDPVDRGFEREIRKRLDWWNKLRQIKTNNKATP